MRLAFHVTLARNVPAIREHGLLVKAPRDMRDVPGVYLFPDRDTMDDAWDAWMEDRFDEEAELSILAVNVEGLELESDVEFELRSRQPISPDRIVAVERA